jgi:hypothetical protein
MKMSSFLPRALLTVVTVWGVHAVNTMHEIMSPLVSGPMAAQQLTNSNTAYVGTQVMSRMFDGSGFNGTVLNLVLAMVMVAIWWAPLKNVFRSSEKA